MSKSNRLGVFEVANRVSTNNVTNEVVEGLAGHQSQQNTSAHEISNISGLQNALNGKQNVISGYTGIIDIVVSVDFANQTSKTAKINVSNGIIISIN